MKLFFLSIFLFLFSASLYSKTITVTGLRAKALLAIGSATNSTGEVVNGKTDMELNYVNCEKIVDDINKEYSQTCYFSSFSDVIINSNKNEKSTLPEEFRMALKEILNNEIIVSNTQKLISVRQINCQSIGEGHTLDKLSSEQSFTCTLETE